jgi:hypothetical protein
MGDGVGLEPHLAHHCASALIVSGIDGGREEQGSLAFRWIVLYGEGHRWAEEDAVMAPFGEQEGAFFQPVLPSQGRGQNHNATLPDFTSGWFHTRFLAITG